MKAVVLGAGLSGLSCAHRLSSEGVEVEVLEAEDQVGGMAKSFTDEGYTFDLGPHRFHTQDSIIIKHINDLMGDDMESKLRVSRIFLEGRFFDYPLRISNAVFGMPPLTMARILSDYAFAKAQNILSKPKDDSFETWVKSRFGKRLYDIYFKVYTEKTWGIPCDRISADWAVQRISLLSLWDTVLKTIFKGGDTPRTYVSRFLYPAKSGIGAISEKYAKIIGDNGGRIFLGAKVDKIKIVDGTIKSIGYNNESNDISESDIVLSTIPPHQFIFSICGDDVPKKVLEACERLVFRSIVFVHLKISKESVSKDHWIYLPEPVFSSNRMSETRNFSRDNSPRGKTLLTFEITCQYRDDIWNANDGKLKKMAVKDLCKSGLASEADIMDAVIKRQRWAYPVYDLEYRQNLDIVVEYLKSIKNLRFFGRNGLFRYNNMDHSISMGLFAADSVLDKDIDYMAVATENHWFG